jgi:hypothetical protein
MGAWNEARLEALKVLFLKRGEVHTEADAAKCEVSHDAELPEGLKLPDSLRATLKLGAKWNFTKGSYDVFNGNLYVKAPADTTDIFGDEDCRAERLKEHGGESSCAGKDWALVYVTSEYDFYFVNLRADSPEFGAVRHIVNNCYEEEAFTAAPFDRFLDVVEAWAEASAAETVKPGEDEEDIEYDDLRDFLPAKKQRVAQTPAE